MADLKEVASEAKSWMENDALPFWFEHGIDRDKGGFIEQLTVDCEPIDEPTRPVRVAARQIYVFALAADRGWFPEGRDVALEGVEYLLSRGLGAGGLPGCPHSLTPDGLVADSRRDAYDHAFILLALAWAWRVTQEPRIEEAIGTVLLFCDDCLADQESGGWFEGQPALLPRRQNPQMHALEAMLALHDAFGGTEYLTRATDFVVLFREKLLPVGEGNLLEYFDGNWTGPAAAVEKIVEPGHYFEWAWLLAKYADRKEIPLDPSGQTLRTWALDHGMNPAGFAFDQCTPDGQIEKSSSRLWPQTECAKAHLTYAAHGDVQAAALAAQTIQNLMSRYVKPAPRGAWFDCLKEDGRIVDDRLISRTFYHIACMIDEAVSVSTALV